MLRYRAVLFDLDGTLVDSYSALADAVNFARRQFGLGDLSEETIRDFVGEGLERLLRRAFDVEDVPAGATEAFEARYDEICCEQSRVLDDVENTLSALSRIGVAMAVCTNKPTSFSRKILEFLHLAPFFCAIVGPDTAGARKPEPQHVLRTLEATNCRRAKFTASARAEYESTSVPSRSKRTARYLSIATRFYREFSAPLRKTAAVCCRARLEASRWRS